MSEYSRWSTSAMVCAPFLDTYFEPSQRAAMLRELRRRGYPRPVVVVLRAIAGLGLWWNLVAWEWAHLDFWDVLFGYSINFALAALGLALAAVYALVTGGPAALFASFGLACAAICFLLWFAATRGGAKARRSGQRAA